MSAALLAALPAALSAQGSGSPARAEAVAPKRVEARRVVAAAPRIDGRLDDAAWASAVPVTGFSQLRPDPGAPASERAEVRVVYDEAAIYVAMRLYDDPDSVVTQLARRDASGIFSDWAHVMIDSYHDRRTAFRFSVTPSGTKKDVLHYDDTGEDLNWDAVWEAGTRIDSAGWTAEFRIPLSQLRFSLPDAAESGSVPAKSRGGAVAPGTEPGGAGGAEMVWGVNFGRDIARHDESAWWSPVLPNSGVFVSAAGELRGLVGLESPRRLEVLPYSVARLTRAPADPGNPFYEASDPAGSIGVDVRYGVTSNLTLSATINPDFGQVEADPSVVNLSAFETFYPEKRPFFIEGSNIFQFGVGVDDGSGEGLFYSRRIGRTPQRGRFVDGGYVDGPDATTILGAAKLSGKTANGWTIGVLDAVTGEEEARVATAAGGDVATERVEPLTNYAVATVSRDFGAGRSTVGAFVTATNRRLGGGDDLAFLRSAAYTAGVRGRHRFAAGAWQASGYIGGSHIRGGEAAIARVQMAAGHYFQRPDAEHLDFDPSRTSLSGAVANLWIAKIGGDDHWRGGFGGHVRTPGFEVNDLGYQNDADQAMIFANLRYLQTEPGEHLRNWYLGMNPSSGWTTGGERIWSQVNFFGGLQLHNFWEVFVFTSLRASGTDPVALRGGPSIRHPGGFSYSLQVNTDHRKVVSAHLNFIGSREFGTGGGEFQILPYVTVRPSSRLSLQLVPSIDWNHDAWQYVGQPEAGGARHYIFAALDQTTVSLTTRLNLTLTPTLSFDLYAQPFVSGGEYGGFMEAVDPGAARFDRRFHVFREGDELRYDPATSVYTAAVGGGTVEFADPDFNFREMRGNAVLRWEYLPGSTLYLVWSQSRTGFLGGPALGDVFDIGRDAGRLFNRADGFRTPVTDVFLVKVSYWLSF